MFAKMYKHSLRGEWLIMEKIVVRNFGPIDNICIDIPRLLVLIGDQATGKSTVSKLIYIFRDVATKMGFNCNPNYFNKFLGCDDVEHIVENSIVNAFDICFAQNNSEIEYYYNDKCFIKVKIHIVQNNKLQYNIELSSRLQNFINEFSYYNKEIFNMKKENTIEGNTLQSEEEFLLQKKIYKLTIEFCTAVNISHSMVYIGADRMEPNAKKLGFSFFSLDGETPRNVVRQFITILKMSEEEEFNQIVSKIRQNNEDKPCNGILDLLNKEMIVGKTYTFRKLVAEARKLIGGIIEEKENVGYGLNIDAMSVFVPYDYLSSGQKALMSLVGTICLIGSKGMEMFNPLNAAILEEPEAHIFPTNQFSFIKLLANVLELNNSSRFVITTHSPYILSSIHALVAYGKLSNDNNELKKNNTLTGLKSGENDLGIYILKNGEARSLRDDDTGLFNTEEIDGISDEINEILEFSILEKLVDISTEDC